MSKARREAVEKEKLVSRVERMSQRGGDERNDCHLCLKHREGQVKTEVFEEIDLMRPRNREQYYLV